MGIITDLVSFSRIEAGQISCGIAPIQPSKVFESVVDQILLKSSVQRHQVNRQRRNDKGEHGSDESHDASWPLIRRQLPIAST